MLLPLEYIYMLKCHDPFEMEIVIRYVERSHLLISVSPQISGRQKCTTHKAELIWDQSCLTMLNHPFISSCLHRAMKTQHLLWLVHWAYWNASSACIFTIHLPWQLIAVSSCLPFGGKHKHKLVSLCTILTLCCYFQLTHTAWIIGSSDMIIATSLKAQSASHSWSDQREREM